VIVVPLWVTAKYHGFPCSVPLKTGEWNQILNRKHRAWLAERQQESMNEGAERWELIALKLREEECVWGGFITAGSSVECRL